MEIVHCDFDWGSIVAILIAGGIGLAKHLSSKNRRQETRILTQETLPEEEMTVAEYKRSIYSPVSESFSRDIFLEEEDEDEKIDEPEIMPGDYYYNEPLPKKEISIPPDSPLFQEQTEEEEVYDFDIRKAIISSEILKRPQF